MTFSFAERIQNVPKSFIREILKVTESQDIISFAGGLPNPEFFPVKALAEACQKVLQQDGRNSLQYNVTEGYFPLREYIAEKYYKKKGVSVKPERIIITNGSQQGIDLLARILIDPGDGVILEKPGYLGMIQAFSLCQPRFYPVRLEEDGIDIEALEKVLQTQKIKVFYAVTNFHNPSGITYSDAKRRTIAGLMKKYNIVFIEDNPYEELRFLGQDLPSLRNYYNETILLGTFSKTVVPSFRLGWLCASDSIIDKVITAKQASDLHTNFFNQKVIYQFLMDNDIEVHIRQLKQAYKKQCAAMVRAMKQYLPAEISFTQPEGGMFIWASLPENVSAMALFELAINEKVAFVPGDPFYVDGDGTNTIRLNYSNSDEAMIEEGIKRLAKAYSLLKNS